MPFHPRLEALEDRLTPAMFYPTSFEQLQGAILQADGNADLDNTIQLAATAYQLTGGSLVIDTGKQLTIAGQGEQDTRVQGSGTDRVFLVRAGTVTFQDLTIRGGRVTSPEFSSSSTAQGGGVFIEAGARVTFQDVTLTDNQAVGANGKDADQENPSFRPAERGADARGGAVYFAGESLTLLRTTVSENLSRGGKGGRGRHPHSRTSP